MVIAGDVRTRLEQLMLAPAQRTPRQLVRLGRWAIRTSIRDRWALARFIDGGWKVVWGG